MAICKRLPSAKIGALAVGFAVMALLSGCTTAAKALETQTKAVSEPALGTVSTVSDPAQVSRPVDTYLPNTAQIIEYALAEQNGIGKCMAEKGEHVTFQFTSANADLAAYIAGGVADRVARSDLWGFFDLKNASTSGYKRPATVPGMLTAVISAGGSGETAGLCNVKVDEKLPNSSSTFGLADYRSLPDRGPVVPLTDSRVVAAVAGWSSCMKTAGFIYPDPLAAIGDAQWQGNGSSVASALEIATASADVSCKISTNLIGVELAVQTAYDQQYIDSQRAALVGYQNKLNTFLRSNASTK